MNEELEPRARATPEQRERVEMRLCDHFAAGHIELEELERRLEVVDRATAASELDELLRDLPELEAAMSPPPLPAPVVREGHGWALAVMGGNSRKGRWTPPGSLHSVAVMGGVELDFRETRLPPGITRVTALAVMGGVEIIVPPDLPVEVRGFGLLGSVDQTERDPGPEEAVGPRLQITAFACMGGVEVKTRPHPGAEVREEGRG